MHNSKPLGWPNFYSYFFLAAFHFAHLARCAAAMRFRAAGDIVRLPVLALPRVPPLLDIALLDTAPVSACSAASMRARSCWSSCTMLASFSMGGL